MPAALGLWTVRPRFSRRALAAPALVVAATLLTLVPWTVREVWIAAGPDPNHYVDVTATFPRKIAALRAHESQTGHMEDLTERLKTRLTLTARLAGLPEGHLAEGFRVLDTA